MTKLIGSITFSYVCAIQPVIDNAGTIVQYEPQALYTKRSDLLLNDYGKGPFCRFRIPNSLRHEGVYALSIADEVQYIGECEDLASRYNMGYGQISPRNCYQKGQPTNCRLNNLIYQAALADSYLDLWFFKTNTRKTVEVELIQALQPKWNRKGIRM